MAPKTQAPKTQAPETQATPRRDDPPGVEPAGPDRDTAGAGAAPLQRRAVALRLVPILACLLFHFPLILQGSEGWSTAWIGLYLFGVWALLIALVALLSRVDPLGEEPKDGPGFGGSEP